jgi:transposase
LGSTFVHGVDAEDNVVVARRLRRKEVLAFFAKLPPCLVGMEACGSAHYWAREITKLGHIVKLMPVAAKNATQTIPIVMMATQCCRGALRHQDFHFETDEPAASSHWKQIPLIGQTSSLHGPLRRLSRWRRSLDSSRRGSPRRVMVHGAGCNDHRHHQ